MAVESAGSGLNILGGSGSANDEVLVPRTKTGRLAVVGNSACSRVSAHSSSFSPRNLASAIIRAKALSISPRRVRTLGGRHGTMRLKTIVLS